MPRIPVDECPAGPAVDAAVAITLGLGDVFRDDSGWCVASGNAAFRRARETDSYFFEQEGHFCYPLAPYSTDIAASWGLWSRLCTEWYYAKLLFVKDLRVEANLYRNSTEVRYGNPTIMAIAEDGLLAICRAFLKAKGVEFVEMAEEEACQSLDERLKEWCTIER